MNKRKFLTGVRERLETGKLIAEEKSADLIIKNGSLVNVATREVLERDVAIIAGRIGSVGRDLDRLQGKDTDVINASGLYLVPGFIDAHLHIESSMLSPGRFARLMAGKGVTGVFFDPHEIANVAGISGVRWMVEEVEKTPLNGFLTVPSCIPASSPELETTGAEFGLEEIKEALEWDSAVALGEMMNFPGVLTGDGATIQKLDETFSRGLPVEGHASGLGAGKLDGYGAMGVDSDHEAVTKEEGVERARKGFWAYVREGSGWADLTEVIKALTETDLSSGRFCLVTDDRDPVDLIEEGGVDHVVRRAIEEGLDPVEAITLATLNPATRFGLDGEIGSISPGRKADINIISDLNELEIEETLLHGVPMDEVKWPKSGPSALTDTVNLADEINPSTFELSQREKNFGILVHPDDIITEKLDFTRDSLNREELNKCAVLERHNLSGNVGRSLVSGFDIADGAIATTVAHDSHNLVVLGENESDMVAAARNLVKTGGGQVVVRDQKPVASVELPIAGLMNDAAPRKVADSLEEVKRAVDTLGCSIPKPLMILSSLALAVIPEVRVTDRGLVDVNEQELIH
ncbi:adenine deaminase [Candidatus Bipolaricaulota bacterium]|nr:adenine deaminase [Candidatus Bipolaricaulota bacterium]